jgi:hypothetical protein
MRSGSLNADCMGGASIVARLQPAFAVNAAPHGNSCSKGFDVLVLVSGATKFPRTDDVGHLIVPRQWNDPDTLTLEPWKWAMDNGCFTGLDEGGFIRMLYAYRRKVGCLFVTVPDKVGDAAATLQLWPFWSTVVRSLGHQPAFVAQNGLTPERVPWTEFGTLFIGGDDAYKDGPDARTLCGIAKAKGIWVHWGRVNGKRRYELAKMAGADSIDGTGFSMYPDTNIPKVADWEETIAAQPQLDLT